LALNTHNHPSEKPGENDTVMGDEYGTWVAVSGEWVDITVVVEFYRKMHAGYFKEIDQWYEDYENEDINPEDFEV